MSNAKITSFEEAGHIIKNGTENLAKINEEFLSGKLTDDSHRMLDDYCIALKNILEYVAIEYKEFYAVCQTTHDANCKSLEAYCGPLINNNIIQAQINRIKEFGEFIFLSDAQSAERKYQELVPFNNALHERISRISQLSLGIHKQAA